MKIIKKLIIIRENIGEFMFTYIEGFLYFSLYIVMIVLFAFSSTINSMNIPSINDKSINIFLINFGFKLLILFFSLSLVNKMKIKESYKKNIINIFEENIKEKTEIKKVYLKYERETDNKTKKQIILILRDINNDMITHSFYKYLYDKRKKDFMRIILRRYLKILNFIKKIHQD